MNKIQRLSIISAIVLSISGIAACAATNAPTQSTPTATANADYIIKSIDSGVVAFSNVASSKRKGVYVVSGDTKLKTMQSRVLKLPGYIQVSLKASDGTELESIKARHKRKFGVSNVGQFKATLKTTPPAGSQIVVEHINN